MTTTILGEKREGGVTLSYKQQKMVANETFHYLVKSTTKNESRSNVLSTSGLPIPGDAQSALGVCTNLSAIRRDDNPFYWDVTATFSSDVDNNSQNQNPLNSDPNTWVPIYETFLEPYEEYPLLAINDKPYTNGAGEPLESSSPVAKDNIRWEFFQFENPATVTDEVIAERNNTINDGVFKGREKHTLKLKIRRSVVGFYYGTLRRLVEYSITWKKDNWHDKIANVGQSFVSLGTMYPYRYEDEPDTVRYGPLGFRHYLYNEDLDEDAGLPSGGTSTQPDTVYANRPEDPTLYFIERQRFEEVTFTDFLRQ